MEKLKMHSMDIINDNVKKIGELFPECLTEIINDNDKLEKVVDFDKLKTLLSNHIAEGNKERYQFTWPDKAKARALANAPIEATLRPCREESVNFDTTENLYIEGDNLDVLKLLRETYYGKVKMIYIDPPYNTGNDFVYEDDFSQDAETYKANSGQYDDQGNRLQKNQESNGRFHTDWLNMMYPRLKIARDLLTNDGVIFISIDDNEQENLKKICDEVFGEHNFVAQLIWERAFAPKNDARYVSNSHDYVLMFAKNIDKFDIGRLSRTEEANARYSNPDNDPRGIWMSSDISVKTYNSECDYPITTPSGRVIEPPAGRCWRLSKKAFLERLNDNRIWFGPDGNGVPRIKRFLTELKHDGMAPTSIMFHKDVGHSQEGAQEVSKLLGGGYFSGPKPQRLMHRLLTLANLQPDSIVFDFFSGSASTAQAVMQLNAADGGNRKFIMVQLPEVCDVKGEAYNAGYNNICEIGKERIRRAGKKILEEQKSRGGDLFSEKKNDLDVGFRVLKLDTSNMEKVYYFPEQLRQDELLGLISNIKAGRTDEDLLFQVMLDMGVLLSSKIETEIISGKKVFNVNKGYLMACFDENVDEGVITAVAKKEPKYFVMRDSSLANDSVSVNFDQIFEKYSKETTRKVL